MPGADYCRITDGCVTCGDAAVALTVIETAGADARCRDDAGRTELVATELVGAVTPGDRLLAHAGVAIGRLDEEPDEGRGARLGEEPDKEGRHAVRRRVP